MNDDNNKSKTIATLSYSKVLLHSCRLSWAVPGGATAGEGQRVNMETPFPMQATCLAQTDQIILTRPTYLPRRMFSLNVNQGRTKLELGDSTSVLLLNGFACEKKKNRIYCKMCKYKQDTIYYGWGGGGGEEQLKQWYWKPPSYLNTGTAVYNRTVR